MRKYQLTIGTLGTTCLLALALAGAGCNSPGRSTGQAINDKMTAHSVKSALGDDPVYKYDDVDVKVYEGNAQLTGFVNSDRQRTRAAEIASHVQGVNQVINEITIKPTPTGPATIRNMEPNGTINQYQQNPNPPPPPR
jgi:hypothetical protein